MRLLLVAVAGSILSVAAESPLRLLAQEPNDSINSGLSCIQNLNYSPPCDTKSVSCWCQDMPFINQINDCTIDTCTESVQTTLTNLQKWCMLVIGDEPQFECIKSSSQYTPASPKDQDTQISLQGTIDRFTKRDNYYDGRHKSRLSAAAIFGICFGVFAVASVLLLCKRALKADSRRLPVYESRRGVYEPRRGRSNLDRPFPRSSQTRPPYAGVTGTTRPSTPPPPYIREPEAAHIKNISEGPEITSYDEPRGSSAA